jgi:hypothetical protein
MGDRLRAEKRYKLASIIGRIGDGDDGDGRRLPPSEHLKRAGMTIRLILENDNSFGPEEVGILVAAFDEVLAKLGLVNRDDPATVAVAKVIMELAKQGERDQARLRDRALKLLSK